MHALFSGKKATHKALGAQGGACGVYLYGARRPVSVTPGGEPARSRETSERPRVTCRETTVSRLVRNAQRSHERSTAVFTTRPSYLTEDT